MFKELLKICQRFVQGWWEIYSKFVQGLSKIAWRFVQELLKMCERFVQELGTFWYTCAEVCQSFVKDLLKFFTDAGIVFNFKRRSSRVQLSKHLVASATVFLLGERCERMVIFGWHVFDVVLLSVGFPAASQELPEPSRMLALPGSTQVLAFSVLSLSTGC